MPFSATCFFGCFRELDAHALDDEALAQVVDHEVDNLGDVLAREGLEDDRLVDAVQELGAEQLLELGHDRIVNLLVGETARVRRRETERVLTRDLAAPTLLVMMMIVLRKSTLRPWPSVRWPSSRICSRTLNTSDAPSLSRRRARRNTASGVRPW